MIVNRELLMNAFLSIPTPVSAWCYRIAKRYINKDERAADFEHAFQMVRAEGIPGDYLEFGVYRGASFITAFEQIRKFGLNDMQLFAFDSFEGLPHGEAAVFEQGDYFCPEPLFCKIITKAGVDMNRVSIISGLYDQTLVQAIKPQYGLTRAAIVQIDCDLYTSTKCVLHFIKDLVGRGTVLFFDDWNAFGSQSEEHGECKAFGEWSLRPLFDELSMRRRDGPSKGFIMNRDLNE